MINNSHAQISKLHQSQQANLDANPAGPLVRRTAPDNRRRSLGAITKAAGAASPAEFAAKNYRTKPDIVAALQKSIADCAATLKADPMADGKSIEPWIGVMQHSSEHYGLLVAYYRANGLVPPASRPKSK